MDVEFFPNLFAGNRKKKRCYHEGGTGRVTKTLNVRAKLKYNGCAGLGLNMNVQHNNITAVTSIKVDVSRAKKK